MGKIFDDATPEQEFAFIKERQLETFLAAWRWPLSWLRPARRHKRAADTLFEIAYIAYTAYERDNVRWLADGGPFGKSDLRNRGEEQNNLDDINLLNDYYLLAGYALECVLKGCLMAKDPQRVSDDGKLKKLVRTHDLPQMCVDCSIGLSPEELKLLTLIYQQVTWGKYPGPLKPEEMPSFEDPDDQNSKSLNFEKPFHERRAQVLVDGVFNRGCTLLKTLSAPKS